MAHREPLRDPRRRRVRGLRLSALDPALCIWRSSPSRSSWRSHERPQGSEAHAGQDRIEGGDALGVLIAKQERELTRCVPPVPETGCGPAGPPTPGRVARHGQQMHPTVASSTTTAPTGAGAGPCRRGRSRRPRSPWPARTAPAACGCSSTTVRVLKLSPEKATALGRKQVFRAPDAHRELVGMREEPVPEGHEPLLVPVMAGGAAERAGGRRGGGPGSLPGRSRPAAR